MKGFLITETIDNYQLIEDRKSKELYIKGVFSTGDVKNKNGRIYPTKLLENQVSRLMKEVRQGMPLYGQLNHPTNGETDLEKVCLLIEDLKMKGKDVIGKAKILQTPCGNIAKELLLNSEVGLPISSRGIGRINEKTKMVQDDFILLTYDLVSANSNPTSFVKGIMEGVQIDMNKYIDVKANARQKVKEAQDKKMREWLDEYRNQLKEY